MLHKGMRKQEIEEILEGKGEFVQIDYLTRYLKEFPPYDMRNFAYLKLAKIYEGRKMFSDAARMYRNVAINCFTFREKKEYYIKEAEAHIKNLDFIEADKAVKKALGEANSRQRPEIIEKIKAFLKVQAEDLEKNLKRNQASQVYERLLKMDLPEDEKEYIKSKLIDIYERLGKVKEAKFLKGI